MRAHVRERECDYGRVPPQQSLIRQKKRAACVVKGWLHARSMVGCGRGKTSLKEGDGAVSCFVLHSCSVLDL